MCGQGWGGMPRVWSRVDATSPATGATQRVRQQTESSALHGDQQIGLSQQTAQFRDYGLVAFADLRDHHIELVHARGDQACVGDGGVDSADAYAKILRTSER